MPEERQESANGLLYDATKPSYQHWIALPAEAQQEGVKALRSRRVALEARLAKITLEENAAEYRRLIREIGAEQYYNSLPYDPATLSYQEWSALPQDEQSNVIVVLKKRAADVHPQYLALTEAERNAHDVEHRTLVQDLIAHRTRAGVAMLASIAVGKGQVIRVGDDGSIEPQPPLRYDPAAVSYKEWMALPRGEQSRVMDMLRCHPSWLEARFAAMTPEEHEAEDQSLMAEVRAEQERTGIIRPGWILIGKGRRVHHLVRRLPPGKIWG